MFKLLRKRKLKFTLYIIASFFPVITDLLRIGVFALIFDAIEVKDLNYFYKVAIVAIIYIPLSFGIYIASRMMRISFMHDTILDVRIAAFDKIINTSYLNFNKQSKDVYISNLVNDINNFEANFFVNFLNFIYRGGVYLVSLIFLIFIDYKLAIAMFIVSVFMFFLSKAFQARTTKYQKQVSKDNEEVTINLSNVFNGLEILKLNNIEDKFIGNSLDKINKVERSKFKFRFFSETQRNISYGIGFGVFIIVLLYLLIQFESGMTYAKIMIIIQFATGMTFALPDIFPRLNVIKSSSEIYQKITKTEEEYFQNNRQHDFQFNNKITVNNLNFKYDNKIIFEDASFVIQKGKKYLIKGPSGVGKSTLIKLLSMVYEDYDGEIIVDEHNLKTIKTKSFNDQVSFVYQEVFLFQDSIKNNIALYKPINQETLTKAINDSGLREFVTNKPQGIDELISENGKNLSGGERQRISIARSIAKNAQILFVDEGTSALNEELGTEIEKAFLALENTVVAISHRYYPGVSEQYDYVLEIKEGKVNTYLAKDYFSEEAQYA